VERIPGSSKLRTFSTGSKLLGWCKANGEYEGENTVAGQSIVWAKEEKDLEVVLVYNVAKLIRSQEAFFYVPSTSGSSETDLSFL